MVSSFLFLISNTSLRKQFRKRASSLQLLSYHHQTKTEIKIFFFKNSIFTIMSWHLRMNIVYQTLNINVQVYLSNYICRNAVNVLYVCVLFIHFSIEYCEFKGLPSCGLYSFNPVSELLLTVSLPRM